MGSAERDEQPSTEASQIADAQRDPSRFGVLYEQHFDVVSAFVTRRVRDRGEAEDVTATVFQKALAGLPRYEWRGTPFAAWLVTIASNELADRRRRQKPTVELSDEDVPGEHALEEVEGQAMVFGLVRDLPEMQRRVVMMRFAEDRAIKDIAQEIGRTEGAVKQLQLRALDALRARLGDACA